MIARLWTALACLPLVITAGGAGPEAGLPRAEVTERQPLLTQVARVRQALERLGAPMSAEAAARLDGAAGAGDDGAVTRAVEAALDPLCIAAVRVDGEGRATAV